MHIRTYSFIHAYGYADADVPDLEANKEVLIPVIIQSLRRHGAAVDAQSCAKSLNTALNRNNSFEK